MSMLRPAVFLDRDGVLNVTHAFDGVPRAPADSSDFKLLAGVVEACRTLREAGIALIVVTNQPEVARGGMSSAALERIHARLRKSIDVDAIYTCPHDDTDDCDCRKPRPGMLLRAARELGLDLSRSVMVGDRWRDLDAGRAAGTFTVHVQNRHREPLASDPDLVVESLSEAVPWIQDRLRRPTSGAAGLRVKIFADGADLDAFRALAVTPFISGFTTNPTLMRRAGVVDYEEFARELVSMVPHRPISFEAFADDFDEMERQARKIASWGENVRVKIPITNTSGESSLQLVRRLAADGIGQNVTAVLTIDQVEAAADALGDGPPSFISIFAGRIADTGRDPVPLMKSALQVMKCRPNEELIWASPRELLNIAQADAIGCHIITVTPELLNKLPLLGRDLDAYSLETVRMFHDDALAARYIL